MGGKGESRSALGFCFGRDLSVPLSGPYPTICSWREMIPVSSALPETGHLLGFASPSALTIRSVRYLHPPFHYLPPSYSHSHKTEGGARGMVHEVCQNGAKVENATAHPYNVADMRDSQRGREARVEGGGQAGRRCVPSASLDPNRVGGSDFRPSKLSNPYILLYDTTVYRYRHHPTFFLLREGGGEHRSSY